MSRGRVRFPAQVRANRWGGLAEAVLSYAPTTRGRASRMELVLTIFAASILGTFAGRLAPPHPSALTPALDVLLGVLIALPVGSAILRRLHDVGRNWTSLVVLLAPYVGVLIFGYYLFKPSIYDD
ncbi:MAG: DUF805 domain-containing protein [Candidatus Andeanibacterium colombiense]|uniref:DUF805 domain-containing protein n=1 Tax=Candidatus Andeanibacterium colombiense TaxID=3121345 RepID=A0AAJ5X2F0_9SPHN|nr:MAG: DUF805 domain-containing protein [Sphingomonadaceae bacterium]